MRRVEIFSPVAEVERVEISSAPRLETLEGQQVGFLDNAKPNVDVFLSRVEELLQEQFALSQVIRQRKRHGGRPAEDVDELARRCHVVVNGVGD
jgi:hypothetical protein